MSFYRDRIFPHVLELAMRSRVFRKPRTRTLAPATGRILEIGFGTGMNLGHYPPTVRRIDALDPDPRLERYAAPRIEASAIKVEFHRLDAARLPFAAASFDTVVSTLTLCSIADVEAALREVRRVLAPRGSFLFFEHGLSPEPAVARWQHRLDGLQQRVGGGCHLNRPMRALVEGAGLQLDAVRDYYLRRVPRFVGYVTEGVASRRES